MLSAKDCFYRYLEYSQDMFDIQDVAIAIFNVASLELKMGNYKYSYACFVLSGQIFDRIGHFFKEKVDEMILDKFQSVDDLELVKYLERFDQLSMSELIQFSLEKLKDE